MLKSLNHFIQDKLDRHRRFNLFREEFNRFYKKSKSGNRDVPNWKDIMPILNEKTTATEFDKHYVYHTAWALRVLKRTNPKIHVDISSSLYFSAMASAYHSIKFYDYRPASIVLDNLVSKTADILDLPFENATIPSLSCMHVVEHIGLGRYGDPIDPNGDIIAINELKRVLLPKGYLLFVTPVGKPKVSFNAHRIYSYEQIVDYFAPLKLEEFTLISNKDYTTGLVFNACHEKVVEEEYGCGCFLFTKS